MEREKMREKRQTFPEHSQQTKQSCLSQLKPNIVLIETGNAPDAGLSPEPESELMPAGFGVNAPASGPAPTELQSRPQPTPTTRALGPVIWQLSDGTTRHNGRSGPQESDGGGTEKINPDRRSDPRVQTSPGPPPSALEKAHQAHNSERRGWALCRTAGALRLAAPRWKEACLLPPRRRLRLSFLLPRGTVELKWCPHPTWVTMHRPAPGGDAQAATHNHANSRASLTQKQPPAVWPGGPGLPTGRS